MKTLLKALCLTFSIGVLAVLTTNAARDGEGCNSPSTSSAPQAAPPAQAAPTVAPAPPAPPAPSELVGADVAPNKPNANVVPSERFIGASKAGPVFLPKDLRKQPAQPTPQQQAPQQQAQ